MPVITLPDRSKRSYDRAVTPMGNILDVNPDLVEITIAGNANGKLIDIFNLIEDDVSFSFVTVEDRRGLEIIRRFCAHLLGRAIKQL